ncbi:SpoIIAA-like [Reichenbachiella agariperforans]|uniref:SpoIIAA-like n=2 Tax=Reichenbachiella agariperforans TaxID=156994 RepID=A0A1M6JRW8_REIAG|nr:SpoIIAA-like [Reichenbachiella agariperforans]
MLYHLKSDFTGFELSALWDDAKLGMKHLTEWERIALVSDHEMVNSFVMFFSHLVKADIKLFRDSELSQAKKWIVKN